MSARAVFGWVGQVVAWAVILAALTAIAVMVVIPRIGGATPYTILTGSMRPHMPPGTLVVSKPIDTDKLGIGDVVTYQLHSGEPAVVTHRIVAISSGADGSRLFQTKGDANNTPDAALVRPVQVRGKLWYSLPWLGRVNVLFNRKQHQTIVYVAAAALIGYALVMFVGAGRDRVRARRSGERHKGERKQEVGV